MKKLFVLGLAMVLFSACQKSIDPELTRESSWYYVFEGTNYPWSGGQWKVINMLRDSSGYLVDVHGIIRFAPDNFTEVLASKTEIHSGDTLYTLTYKMEAVHDEVTVPAGKFRVLNYKGTVTMPQNQLRNSESPVY